MYAHREIPNGFERVVLLLVLIASHAVTFFPVIGVFFPFSQNDLMSQSISLPLGMYDK